MSPESIIVSAVVMQDPQGRVLTVRKQGTGRFMLPGGKPEPGEDALSTAVREAAEELGVDLSPQALQDLGCSPPGPPTRPGPPWWPPCSSTASWRGCGPARRSLRSAGCR
ncbi:NUDIX domain-containing protein [Actinomyces weissii]|uniref:NUDIX domain-containing protein n=1 Tax=Actinomyces weissii TaxID=675090 RepID=A0A7T7MBP8_9ACTO|nr:NUDIX domain-containing protein [Actinomyces weissii]